ncbi:MAG TPA: RNA-binding transcriptional accessory protein [Oribacterium sp.]|nr:RNA-binding transcriptional accessory protein [Oribacterium sp.]
MNIIEKISQELQIKTSQTEAVIRLIDAGNTIPFIARYRKEATGGMHDDVLRALDERLRYLRNLEERKQTILRSIEEQGKLDDALRKDIEAAETVVKLEDLYRPYKPKRRTRAMIARERGLEPLALYIAAGKGAQPVSTEAAKYVDPEREVPDVQTAIQGAEDILAETMSDSAALRTWIRQKSQQEGVLVSSARTKQQATEHSVYEHYYDYAEAVRKIPGHRVLALNRGEKEKVLSVKLEVPEEEILRFMAQKMGVDRHPATAPYLREACADAYKRLIGPSIETELRNELTEHAEDGAIQVFRENLRQLLMQAPITGKTVLGWDPAFRTGCKIAVVDPTGKVLDTTVIFPTAPQNRVAEAMRTIEALIRKYHVDIISLGNGTASRESEQIIADYIKMDHLPVQYVIVNEAGASVYSASALATEEFPNFDVGQRSATSMARRLQDPLAELVKIDPKSIGVGQYQHDMNQTKLSEQLSHVVEDCVNSVGIDVNTASVALLSYISGINKTTARNIVAYREENGRFKSRKELLKVPKLGPKAYEQCAGFLRIRDGKEALDDTAVHPESYAAAKALLTSLGATEADLHGAQHAALSVKLQKAKADISELAEKLKVGTYTLEDILEELIKPGRDPREDVPAPVLRSDVLTLEDLKPEMELQGTVRNIVDFGAFVDIGVHQDGLVHISQLADRFVKHPLDVVKVGDIVRVRVLSVDPERKKIALSMKGVEQRPSGRR